MEDEEEHGSEKQVTMIPTDRIRILNPRVRNRRAFEEMVANIASIGLEHVAFAPIQDSHVSRFVIP